MGSKISKLSVANIIEKVEPLMREYDMAYFCDHLDAIHEYIRLKKIRSRQDIIYQFLIDNEDKINKEKMILLIVKNYKENIEMIKEQLKLEEAKLSINTSIEQIKKVEELKSQIIVQTENLRRAISLGKGIEVCIILYCYDEAQERYRIEVTDSREIIDGKHVSATKNLKRFDEMEDSLKDDKQLGLEYVLQSLLLTDFYSFFPDEEFGHNVRTMILENAILKRKIKTKDEIQDLKRSDSKKYFELINSVSFKDLLPEVKQTLREYVKYIDIDKMLLVAGYRFNEALENGNLENKDMIAVKQIMESILENIKSKNSNISCILENNEDESYDEIEVQYSVDDLKNSIRQFVGNKYFSEEEIKEYRQKATNGEIKFSDLSIESIEMLFSEDEIEQLVNNYEENFEFIAIQMEWSKDRILEQMIKSGKCSETLLNKLIEEGTLLPQDLIDLYMRGIIQISKIEELAKTIDFSELVNSNELNQHYYKSIDKDATEEEKERYKSYLELYKKVISQNKENEDLYSSKLMEQIVDDYQIGDREPYILTIENYYKEGLLTLDSILEWENESLVNRLYDDNLISTSDLSELFKKGKLSFELISGIYSNIMQKDDISYDERVKYILTGFVSEQEVFDLFSKNLIFEEDMKYFAKKAIIRQSELDRIINSRNKEELENKSAIKLLGLSSLSKKSNEIYGETTSDGYNTINKNKQKLIIDPNERMEYISLFKARRAETDLEEENPFYNYEFYVIPDESGEIGLNSVVIAERYYEDKQTEEKFTLNNATYFFKYKDLLVLSNMRKSEMTQERKNIVFTANHTIATDKKVGRWAASVLYGIVKTMLSSDLKEYSKDNQRRIILQKLGTIYSEEEIMEILDKGQQIDVGELTYEIIDLDSTALKRKSAGTDIEEDAQVR